MKKLLLLLGGISTGTLSIVTITSCGKSTTDKPKQEVLSAKTDKDWTVPSDSYSDHVEHVAGTKFYNGVELKVAPTFEQWYNTYATSDDKTLSLFSGKEPTHYTAHNLEFAHVYGPEGIKDATGLYSGVPFKVGADNKEDGRIFDLTNAPSELKARKDIKNGWEHVTPQSNLEAGAGALANHAKADLNNLRPSIQNEFNGPRSNHPFGIVKGDDTKYGIDFEIGQSVDNSALTVVEPRPEVRGDIARVILYTHDTYHVTYDRNYYRMLILWTYLDPVSNYEKALDEKNFEIMGLHNPYIAGTRLLPTVSGIKDSVTQTPEPKLDSKPVVDATPEVAPTPTVAPTPSVEPKPEVKPAPAVSDSIVSQLVQVPGVNLPTGELTGDALKAYIDEIYSWYKANSEKMNEFNVTLTVNGKEVHEAELIHAWSTGFEIKGDDGLFYKIYLKANKGHDYIGSTAGFDNQQGNGTVTINGVEHTRVEKFGRQKSMDISIKVVISAK